MNPKNTPTAPKAKPAATLPVKTFRLGRIKAAVWENEANNKKFYNVTFAAPTWAPTRNSTTPTVSVATTFRSWRNSRTKRLLHLRTAR